MAPTRKFLLFDRGLGAAPFGLSKCAATFYVLQINSVLGTPRFHLWNRPLMAVHLPSVSFSGCPSSELPNYI